MRWVNLCSVFVRSSPVFPSRVFAFIATGGPVPGISVMGALHLGRGVHRLAFGASTRRHVWTGAFCTLPVESGSSSSASHYCCVFLLPLLPRSRGAGPLGKARTRTIKRSPHSRVAHRCTVELVTGPRSPRSPCARRGSPFTAFIQKGNLAAVSTSPMRCCCSPSSS